MQWDLGLQGLAIVAAMSIAFGAFTQVLFWNRANLWLGAVAAVLSFVGGLFVSEVWFGWATEAELQPNIDGLSFDETLLAFLVAGLAVLVARIVMSRTGRGPIALSR